MNGLAPSMLINFNNGTPRPEERQLIENKYIRNLVVLLMLVNLF